MTTMRGFMVTAACVAGFGAVVASANALYFRRLTSAADRTPPSLTVKQHVLIPARNEQNNLAVCIDRVLAAGADTVTVYDDDSSDATGEIATRYANTHERVHLAAVQPLPASGWLGKTWACQQLANYAAANHRLSPADELVFIDADVRVKPGGLRAATQLRQHRGLDVLYPYPEQVATTVLARIVQPLLQWSWYSFIPHPVGDFVNAPAMAVGNGQLTCITWSAYQRVGGHRSVAGSVLEDMELARNCRRVGLRTAVHNGSHIATCTMYSDDDSLINGYTKSLWAAFGTGPSSSMVIGLLASTYVLPAIIAVTGPRSARLPAAVAVGAAWVNRAMVAASTRSRVMPDSASHPVGIVALALLWARSRHARSHGQLQWRGREISPRP